MERRQFLKWTAAGGLGGCGRWTGASLVSANRKSLALAGLDAEAPAYSVIPVVGDGKWIWTEPPPEAQGYMEPRSYRASVGIELEGLGGGTEIIATTPVPLEHPEQKIIDVQVETSGCEATLRQLTSTAGQLVLMADQIAKGQRIVATAHYQLTLHKQYHGYERDRFPEKQKPPTAVRRDFLQDSPGIQTSAKVVRDLAGQLSKGLSHPWDRARAFAEWVPRNIRPQIGSYTSVIAALERRLGDCEEMAGVFVALCRSVGIPARLVWVPNHNWAEFYLQDAGGEGHWIPAHTACYPWFGWTGVHELVLQKGDRLHPPEEGKRLRLMDDWLRCAGRKPRVRFTAEIQPEAASAGEDAGPGARRKDGKGEWLVVGTHPLDKYQRR